MPATAAVRFRIGGPLRFLSHAETSRVFQRACTRAAIPVRYTQGFNPHPRLSLPLPRPVGVESEDELLLARLADEQGAGRLESLAGREEAMKEVLAGQLPDGIAVLSVTLTASNASVQPRSVEYVFPVRVDEDAELRGRLEEGMARVMGSECCMVERASPKHRRARCLDVRPFLGSICLENTHLVVQCLTGSTGSVRIDEIMQLFGLRTEDLAGPVRRTQVTWETT
jgi:radical SAM-linked protein